MDRALYILCIFNRDETVSYGDKAREPHKICLRPCSLLLALGHTRAYENRYGPQGKLASIQLAYYCKQSF